MKRIRSTYFKGITKRFLVWLVAFAMLITIAPIAVFAETEESGAEQTNPSKTEQESELLVGAWEEQVSQAAKNAGSTRTLKLDKETAVTAGENSSVVFSFKPEETAEYSFSTRTGDQSFGTPCVFLYDNKNLEKPTLGEDYDWDEDGVCKIKEELTAGITYYFEVREYDDAAFSYYVTLRKVEQVNITLHTGRDIDEAWYWEGGKKVSQTVEEFEVGEIVDVSSPYCIDELIFVGWSVNQNATEPDGVIYVKSGMKSLYAVWKRLVPLTEDAETALEEEDGSTYYIFNPKTLKDGERYEVSVQLQGNEGDAEILSSLYEFDNDDNATLLQSRQEQGSSLTWLLSTLPTGQDYYFSFKEVNGAALNGTVLIHKVKVFDVTFDANHKDAYYTTVDEDTGEEKIITAVIETLKTGTVIQYNASGTSTSLYVPSYEGNIRFLGWSTNKNATVPDAEIVLGTTKITVYGVWETGQGHTHTPAPAVKENETAASCTVGGSYDEVTYCSECKEEISRDHKTTPATGHEWDEGVVTTKPTCEGKGVKTFTCKHDSSHTETEPISATGHKWGEWTVQKEATEEEDGWEKRICENDPSHEETRIIPKQNHTHSMKKVDAKAASLEEAGWTEHWECEECGLLFADEAGTEPLNAEDITIPKLIDVSEAQISVSEAVYTGKALTPDVTVVLFGKILAKDADYTLEFSNNTNAGKGTVTVSGTGLYGGTAEGEFTIKKASSTLTLKNKTAVYTGEEIAIDPAVAAGSSGNITYTYYKDAGYSEPAESHASVGTYYVKADLAEDDNYGSASAKAVLTIKKTSSQISLQGKSVIYNGKPVSSNKASVTGSTGEIRYSYYSDKACTKAVAVPQNAGTYYVKATVEADANFEEASAVATIVIKPVTTKISVKAGSVKFAKVKKKAQPVKGTIRISSPSGKATYIRVKKGSSKCLTINKKTGTITVQRGTKKGTYQIKVKVTVPKTRNSTVLSKTVTVKVKVR